MAARKYIPNYSYFTLIAILLFSWQNVTAVPTAHVTASSHDGHLPENTLDGKLKGKSRWSAKGDGEWIRYDLGSTRSVEAIRIAFYKGNKRKASFRIQTSNDDINWTTQFDGKSSGKTKRFEDFQLDGVYARYYRIIGFGNTKNDWTSITEVEFVLLTNGDAGDAINNVTVTSSDDDGHVASNAIDANLAPESRWSALGNGQWLQLDLGMTKKVSGVEIAFYKGNKRTANFTLQTSLDAANWITQLEHQISSGKTLDHETYHFPGTNARYVRFIGHGNSQNDWNSIVEIATLEGENPEPPIENPGTGTPANGLQQWKLTLPVSRNYYYGYGGSSAAEILPTDASRPRALSLSGNFSDTNFFFISAENIMIFRTPLSGGSTTTNSSYVRTELRELYNWTAGQDSGSANWNNEGFHKLEATLRIVEYWTKDPQTVVGQIHAKNSKKALVKLQWDGPDKPVRAIINKDPRKGKPFSLTFDTVGTKEFSYTISLNDNIVSISVNGVTQSVEFGKNGMSSAWDNHVYYFKAGSYPQADKNSGSLFETHFSNLKVSHSK